MNELGVTVVHDMIMDNKRHHTMTALTIVRTISDSIKLTITI